MEAVRNYELKNKEVTLAVQRGFQRYSCDLFLSSTELFLFFECVFNPINCCYSGMNFYIFLLWVCGI